MHSEIEREKTERENVERDIKVLTQNLAEVTGRLNTKYEAKEDFEKSIREVESAFGKIVESSQTLLHVTKKEKTTLDKKKRMLTKLE